jgi:hypothetical protein
MDFLTEEERDTRNCRVERLLESYASDIDRIRELGKRGLVSPDLDLELPAQDRFDDR